MVDDSQGTLSACGGTACCEIGEQCANMQCWPRGYAIPEYTPIVQWPSDSFVHNTVRSVPAALHLHVLMYQQTRRWAVRNGQTCSSDAECTSQNPHCCIDLFINGGVGECCQGTTTKVRNAS